MNDIWASIVVNVVDVLLNSMVFWLPILLFPFAAKTWLHYKTESFVSSIEWTLLEIRIPRDIQKSPLAFELFLTNALYQATAHGWYDRWANGDSRLWSSLEIVSIGGAIHFLMRVPTTFKDLVESQLYAQYPQVEILEVEDYTFQVPPLTEDSGWDAWGCEYTLEKADPLPIRTYVDYGLDKDPKEEFKIDPLTATIEFLGSIGKGEQIWIQIGVRATEKKYHTHGTAFGKHDWNEEVHHYIDEKLAPYQPTKDADGRTIPASRAPRTVEDEVKAVQTKSAKLAFDCVIRTVYVARKENYNANNRRSMRMLFRQYGSPMTNGFKRVNSTQFDYGWQEWGGALLKMKEKMMNYYRERVFFHSPMRESFTRPWPFSYFHEPNVPQVFILNSEELASVYHFPGRVSETPTFKRIESKTSQSPWNLPV